MTKHMDVRDRFLEKVVPVESGCHEWQSTLHRDGYGKFWLNGGQIQAHRVSWTLNKGEIPEGLWVLHTCDNRKCVNPEHLYLGTPKENVRDMMERCDWRGNMRFSGQQVEAAIADYRAGKTQQAIADQLGVAQTMVSRWVRNPSKYLRRKYE